MDPVIEIRRLLKERIELLQELERLLAAFKEFTDCEHVEPCRCHGRLMTAIEQMVVVVQSSQIGVTRYEVQ